MAELTDAQKKRQAARKRRRGKDEDSQPEKDSPEQQSEQPLDAVVSAAKVAAAGAAVGAAAAAAKALASRHDGEGAEAEPAKDEQPERQDEQAAAEEPEAQAAEEPEEEQQPPQQPQQQQQRRQEPEREEQQEPVEGAPIADARRVAQRAREELEELLGKPVEAMSSLERTHDGWVVALEVVELQRIPESTDILATYELELDGDLNFRRYQQARRYHRSQADRGDDR